jgi:hypothetical protein
MRFVQGSWLAVSVTVSSVVLGCGGGSLRQVRGATFDLNSQESDLADVYEQQDPKEADVGTRCHYWTGRARDARQPHQIGIVVWRPDHFVSLGAWADAEKQDVCGGEARRFNPGRARQAQVIEATTSLPTVGTLTEPTFALPPGQVVLGVHGDPRYFYSIRFEGDVGVLLVVRGRAVFHTDPRQANTWRRTTEPTVPLANADVCLVHARANQTGAAADAARIALHTDQTGTGRVDLAQPNFAVTEMLHPEESDQLDKLWLVYGPCDSEATKAEQSILNQVVMAASAVQADALPLDSWRGYQALKGAETANRQQKLQAQGQGAQRSYERVVATRNQCMAGDLAACKSCMEINGCGLGEADPFKKACELGDKGACVSFQQRQAAAVRERAAEAQVDAAGKQDALAKGRGFILNRLKAPSTSQFSNEHAFRCPRGFVTYHDVDAQNSFGAMIRNSWVVTQPASGPINGTGMDSSMALNVVAPAQLSSLGCSTEDIRRGRYARELWIGLRRELRKVAYPSA